MYSPLSSYPSAIGGPSSAMASHSAAHSSYSSNIGGSNYFRGSPSYSYSHGNISNTDHFVTPSSRFRDAFSSAKMHPGPERRSASGRPPLLRGSSLGPPTTSSSPSSSSMRSFLREAFDDSGFGSTRGEPTRSSYGIGNRIANKERTRDELIDSILYTRTREHRPMPGFRDATNWEERRRANIDCDKVYPGIYLANGETVQNLDYLKGVGVTHVLNTAERHVPVTPTKYPMHDISYFGFHVDDHPTANISRFFTRTSDFIEESLNRGGVIVVNCVMGWSRSATIVAAFLVAKKGMSATQALETIRQHRPIRPNPGFLQQLADYENLVRKRLVWD